MSEPITLKTITILYSCKQCGIEKPAVEMPERAVALDIMLWMNQVGIRVANDHCLRSPACLSEKCDLMIPVNNETQMIGRK